MNLPQSTHDGLLLAPPRPAAAVIRKVLVNVLYLLLAIAAVGAYEHFKLHGQSTPSLVSLVAAGGFALMPVRAILDELLKIEGWVMHLVHGLGGLAVVGLVAGGSVPGGSVLTHGALAPFAIMGAAQALMHAEHPRTGEQAEALRQFVAGLPELEQLASAPDFTSAANVEHAMTVLRGLIAKAQRLGETELRSDPGFQSALGQATTRFGLSLGLDAIDHTLGRLATNPAAAGALPELRRQLAGARATVDGGRGGSAARSHSGRAAGTTACARGASGAPGADCGHAPALSGAAGE